MLLYFQSRKEGRADKLADAILQKAGTERRLSDPHPYTHTPIAYQNVMSTWVVSTGQISATKYAPVQQPRLWYGRHRAVNKKQRGGREQRTAETPNQPNAGQEKETTAS